MNDLKEQLRAAAEDHRPLELHIDRWRSTALRRRRIRRAATSAAAGVVALGVVATVSFIASLPTEPEVVLEGDAAAQGERPTWRELPGAVAGAFEASVFWTGTDVLLFAPATHEATTVDGALIDPDQGTATPIARDVAWRGGHDAVWAGEQLIVIGGSNGTDPNLESVSYEPRADRWRGLPAFPDQGQHLSGAVADGSSVILWDVGRALDVDTRTWRRIAKAPLSKRSASAVAQGGEYVFVWGGCDPAVPQCDDGLHGDEFADGALYHIPSDRWRPLPDSLLATRDRPEAVWTGSEFLVWGGIADSDAPGAYGAAFNPETNQWRPLPQAPLAMRSNHVLAVADRRVVVWGGTNPRGKPLSDGAVFDLASGEWSQLPPSPLPAATLPSAAWTGNALVVLSCCKSNAVAALALP
jgi:hypothetical protein